jgi:hypothetical protein
MDVQNCDTYINIPSQTYRPHNEYIRIFTYMQMKC